MATDRRGFATTYMAELLFRGKPDYTKRSSNNAMKKRSPGAQPLDGKLDDGLLSFVHTDHLVQFKDGKLPAQTVIMETNKPTTPERYETAIQQSWGFPGARAAVTRCAGSLLIMEMMSSPL